MELGENIRARRQERGWSLEALAERSGVSRAMLSEVERSRKSPTINVLCEIAAGLDCTVSELIEEVPLNRVRIVRADERPTVRDPDTGIERQLLSTATMQYGLEIVSYTLPPGATAGPYPARMLGRVEHITVVSGRLVFVYEGNEERLGPGDSVTYSRTSSVALRNVGRGICTFFLVMDQGLPGGSSPRVEEGSLMPRFGPMETSFDPDEFRREGHRLVDSLGDYLERALAGGDLPVLPRATPHESMAAISGDFPAAPAGGLLELLEELVERSNHLHHPRYVGHQVPPVLPGAALAELTRALLNGGASIYEMGPALTAIELRLVRFFLDRVGFGPEADGFLTSGGSLGNLTALLAMRRAKAGSDSWKEGGATEFCVLASSESHYSVARAVGVMGWGEEGVGKVPVDADFRMVPGELARAKARAEERGRRVLGVVGNACSTATGSFDPLPRDRGLLRLRGPLVPRRRGPRGVLPAQQPTPRAARRRVARADSVIWDLHKMMLLPSLVTAVLFRDRTHSFAFEQDASYVFRNTDPGPVPVRDRAPAPSSARAAARAWRPTRCCAPAVPPPSPATWTARSPWRRPSPIGSRARRTSSWSCGRCATSSASDASAPRARTWTRYRSGSGRGSWPPSASIS